ncbi:MAG: 23S rRNA (uracil-C(5))-methyltransferase RlmCD [Chlamydiia bacterium]|nr:23S rRNA (uracil-C(5))-methyltransferase RlmCD [Chlamydiia bacterium]
MKEYIQKEIEIVDYNPRGVGVGYCAIENRPTKAKVEVIGSVKGDHLQVELHGKRKRAYRGKIHQILNGSKERITPRCKHVGVCGGCTSQAEAYTSQLKRKQERIKTLFAPHIKKDDTTLHPICGCEDPYQYRNKMEFSFSQNREGEKFVGLVIAGTKGYVLNIEECHLISPWVTQVLERVRAWWIDSPHIAFNPFDGSGTLRRITFREGKDQTKMVNLTISGPFPQESIDRFKQVIIDSAGKETSIFLTVQHAKKGMQTTFSEMHLAGPTHLVQQLIVSDKAYQYHISPSSFFQPNTKQAQLLYTRAKELLDIPPNAYILDLYCGTGSIGIAMADRARQVLGIEINPYAVWDAKASCEINQIENVETICGDVALLLKEKSLLDPDIVIVDPPRAGLGPKAANQILQLAPKKILYISCKPESQADDLELLLAGPYRLSHLQPVDQFPHTPHLENIAILERMDRV